MPLWQWDQDAFRAIHLGLHRDWLDPYVRTVTFTGLGYVQAIACVVSIYDKKIGAWGTGIAILVASLGAIAIEKNAPAFFAVAALCVVALFLDRKVVIGALFALVASGLVRLVVESFVDRQRPSNLPFARPLENLYGFSSFPSGHATTSFGIAAFLSWVYAGSHRQNVAAIAVFWAVLVGLSRIYMGVHYPLDVFAAALLGTGMGSLTFFLFKAKGWIESQEENTPIERNLA
ncbi:MAG: phosphatase PAP2 family protein [Armatimonadetes bacterium]|nr:phosphatase PAP2 family protein [Armatimonadota bacterium]